MIGQKCILMKYIFLAKKHLIKQIFDFCNISATIDAHAQCQKYRNMSFSHLKQSKHKYISKYSDVMWHCIKILGRSWKLIKLLITFKDIVRLIYLSTYLFTCHNNIREHLKLRVQQFWNEKKYLRVSL